MKERMGGVWMIGLLVLAIVCGVWLAVPAVLPHVFFLDSSTRTAELFDIVDALFSGLAFAGVIVALLLQRRELQLQRDELEETRKELKGQKEALIGQCKLQTAANVQQVLMPLLLEYRKSDMHEAISALWHFRAMHPDAFVQKYEQARLAGDPIDQQRRLVSHFYGLLAGLHSFGIIDPEVLFSYWSERDLRIIPQILLPIERALEETMFRGASQEDDQTGTGRWFQMLQKLYDEASKQSSNQALHLTPTGAS